MHVKGRNLQTDDLARRMRKQPFAKNAEMLLKTYTGEVDRQMQRFNDDPNVETQAALLALLRGMDRVFSRLNLGKSAIVEQVEN